MKLLYPLAALIALVNATTQQSCSADSHCTDEQFPCCGNGVCGSGSYCLGPCDPRYSFNSTACMPAPICKSGTYKPRVENMMEQVKFLGNTSDTDFIYYGPVADEDDSLIIKMPKESTGGIISSTFFVWYGKITAKFKTSKNAGVISSFIMFSQVEDEIDYEFVGSVLTEAQTNFYFEGMLDYENSVKFDITNTNENWHEYSFEWTPETITWSIDGKDLRTIKRSDTLNSTSGVYQFPQTPSRIQLSIWPGGAASAAEGTREWAGGSIDWDASDFDNNGYLSVAIDEITVECADVPSDAQTQGKSSVSYLFDGKGFLHENIIVSDELTWMSNLGGTGFNTGQEAVEEAAKSSSKVVKSSATSSSSSSSSSSTSTKHSTTKHSTTKSSVKTTSSSTESSESSSTKSKKSTTTTPETTSSSTTSSTSSATSTVEESTSEEQSGFIQNINATVSSISSSNQNNARQIHGSFTNTLFVFLSTLFLI